MNNERWFNWSNVDYLDTACKREHGILRNPDNLEYGSRTQSADYNYVSLTEKSDD